MTLNIEAITNTVAEYLNAGSKIVEPQANDILKRNTAIYFSLPVKQDFGVFALVIKQATVSARALPLEDGNIWVSLSLSYEHPGGGRNRSTIADLTISPDYKLISAHKPGN